MLTRPESEKLKPAIAGLALIAFCALVTGCHDKPDTRPAQTTVDANAPVLSVPLERNGRWIVEARSADNKTYRVMLDTGATINALESEGPLAARPITPQAEAAFLRQGVLNGPTDAGSITATTLSDPKQASLGLTPALRIQGWEMPDGALATRGPLGRLASDDDAPFDAIIGSEAMRNLTWRADYVAGKLTAYTNDAPAHDWQQCTYMTLDPRGRTPIIELGLEGDTTPFLLDTGNDAEILLPQDIFESFAKDKRIPQVETMTSSIDINNRITPRREGLLAGLTIGQKQLPEVRVGEGVPHPNVGLGLLEKMDRFEIDYRHFRFCFDLPAAPKDSTLTAYSTLLRTGDRYAVAGLAPDSRFAASGGKVGDLITMVDQTSVAKLDLAHVVELLSAPVTSEVTVERGGRTVVIKLKKPA
jgi:hypothetical protein